MNSQAVQNLQAVAGPMAGPRGGAMGRESDLASMNEAGLRIQRCGTSLEMMPNRWLRPVIVPSIRRQNKEPLRTHRASGTRDVPALVCFEGNPSGPKGSPQTPLRFPTPPLGPEEHLMRRS